MSVTIDGQRVSLNISADVTVRCDKSEARILAYAILDALKEPVRVLVSVEGSVVAPVSSTALVSLYVADYDTNDLDIYVLSPEDDDFSFEETLEKVSKDIDEGEKVRSWFDDDEIPY